MVGRLYQSEFFKRAALLLLFFSWVIAVNYSILAANLIYPEQSYFYLINEQIKTFDDLISVYANPKMLNIYYIQFFRPSGHFLAYQILIPFLGWANTKGLLLVNFIFLTLTGFFILKIYQALFPHYKLGGYIAFSIYLMHPALMLSRFIAMHFDFAYILFQTWSLYCFILFCQRNNFVTVKLNEFSLFIWSLLLYALAVTFKEPAIMLGPVLFLYFILQSKVKLNWQSVKIISLLALASLSLGFYLTLQWPSIHYTAHERDIPAAILLLLKTIVGWSDFMLQHPEFSWCDTLFPPSIKFILFILVLLSAYVLSIVFLKKHAEFIYRKSLIFLCASCVFFFILPSVWSMGFPWHLSPTLLFLSLLMGFSLDFLFFQKHKHNKYLVSVFIIFILLAGIAGTQTNLNAWKKTQLELTLNRNALLHPPAIKNKLNKDSILVVEDSLVGEVYKLGNATYSILKLGSLDYQAIQKLQQHSYMKYDSLYTGTLFRWIYQMPALHEQVYAFNVENLSTVPTQILYTWLQHYDNIYCVGYDKQANWHDRTAIFKQNLLKEKLNRALAVTTYQEYPNYSLTGVFLYAKNLLLPIPELCQLECDENQECKGFTYINKKEQENFTLKCNYYGLIDTLKLNGVDECNSYIKMA